MNPEKQLAELGIRVLKLEDCIILMCQKCGKIWSQEGLNSWACPNGCNGFLKQ